MLCAENAAKLYFSFPPQHAKLQSCLLRRDAIARHYCNGPLFLVSLQEINVAEINTLGWTGMPLKDKRRQDTHCKDASQSIKPSST